MKASAFKTFMVYTMKRSKINFRVLPLSLLGMLWFFPVLAWAQEPQQDLLELNRVLDHLYDEMMPLCSQLMGVGQGIAGFAALWYIASRVWGHLARAEPIDFYPLLRPFVIGFCIVSFPGVLGLINGILEPTVRGTAAMMDGSSAAIAQLLEQKERAVSNTENWQLYSGESGQGELDRWYKYTHELEDQGEQELWDGIGNDMKFAMEKASFGFRNSVKAWISEVLQVLFVAASLCINTLRTFQLVVLSILGPLVFGFAVFDGFQHTLMAWMARYISVYLWLPVANIFGSILGKIQELMLKMDVSQIQEQGDTFFGLTDVPYIVFMLIGLVGYLIVPSVANYIIQADASTAFMQRITSLSSQFSSRGAGLAPSGNTLNLDAFSSTVHYNLNEMSTAGSSSDNPSASSHAMGNKITGNT